MSIAIVFHDTDGHVRALAESIQAGVRNVGQQAQLFDISQFQFDVNNNENDALSRELRQHDAIVFGCPTLLSGPTAKFRQFMEFSMNQYHNQTLNNKMSAGFTAGTPLSGDRGQTLQALASFAAQHSMLWVNQGHIAENEGAAEHGINHAGSHLGLAVETLPGEHEPHFDDLRTANLFGRRIANSTRQWVAGRNR